MKKEALDLLRKYIDLQIALEIKMCRAATEDFYDESIPWTRREIEAAWKAFTDALGKEKERMKPGRELDAKVDEKVIGRHSFQGTGKIEERDCTVSEFCERCDKPYSYHAIPHYSTDVAAAWQVVEKMIDIGYSVSVDYVEGWRCFMTQGGFGKSPVEATSAPLAICLAALKVFDMEVEDETE